MSCARILSLLAFTGLAFAARASTATETDPLSAKVDAIFARWNKPDSPGCVCAVIRDGKIVHARGYGMADLEWSDTDYLNNDMVVSLLARQHTTAFEPGTRYSYSNSNYVLLAEIGPCPLGLQAGSYVGLPELSHVFNSSAPRAPS